MIRLRSAYHSLIGKPNPLIIANLPAEAALNIVDLFKEQFEGWCPAIVVGCLVYQAAVECITLRIKRQPFRAGEKRFCQRFLDRAVGDDLERDIAFFEIEEGKANRLRQRVTCAYHAGMVVKAGLQIAWLRAIRFMVDNP